MEYIYCFPGIVIEVTPNIKVIRKLVETREKKQNETKQKTGFKGNLLETLQPGWFRFLNKF